MFRSKVMKNIRNATSKAILIYHMNLMVKNNPKFSDPKWTRSIFGRNPVISENGYDALMVLTEIREQCKREDFRREELQKEAA